MDITTKFNIGDTCYLSDPQWLAYTVYAITVHIDNSTNTSIVYNLTRNLNTDYPSGGDKSAVSESTLVTTPTGNLTRSEVYSKLYSIYHTSLTA